MLKQEPGPVATRKIAVLAADGVDGAAIKAMRTALAAQGVQMKVLAAKLGSLKAADGSAVPVDHTILTMPSVLFDGLFIPGGAASIEALSRSADAVHFVQETYRHCKPLGAQGEAAKLVERCGLPPGTGPADGVVVSQAKNAKSLPGDFLKALAKHRFWGRESVDSVPA